MQAKSILKAKLLKIKSVWFSLLFSENKILSSSMKLISQNKNLVKLTQ